MSSRAPSKEERILRAVRHTLTRVVRDTATPPGLKHPLSDQTIEDLRQCLALIAARERELAEEAGRPRSKRPRIGGGRRSDSVTGIPLASLRRRRRRKT